MKFSTPIVLLVLVATMCATGSARATTLSAEGLDFTNYKPNERLQVFYDSLPEDLQKSIIDYRKKATAVAKEVKEYNERPLSGLPPTSFRSAQRKRMKIESQMASLRLEQKEIAKAFYGIRTEGWEPPNNSNIVRLLVADPQPAKEERDDEVS